MDALNYKTYEEYAICRKLYKRRMKIIITSLVIFFAFPIPLIILLPGAYGLLYIIHVVGVYIMGAYFYIGCDGFISKLPYIGDRALNRELSEKQHLEKLYDKMINGEINYND
jgi:hypothetical protein